MKKETIKLLKKLVKPETEIFINIHSVSESGMTRKFSAYVLGKTDYFCEKKKKYIKKLALIRLNGYLRDAGLESLDKDYRIIVKGCGMDMAFKLCYDLKVALYGYEVGIKNQQYKII